MLSCACSADAAAQRAKLAIQVVRDAGMAISPGDSNAEGAALMVDLMLSDDRRRREGFRGYGSRGRRKDAAHSGKTSALRAARKHRVFGAEDRSDKGRSR
jgi:hypothetical protein